jgi:UDP-N-acetylglucosamine 2-epimerase (non-hydrolysing)
MIKILIVFGTRPEVIKFAPLILELKRNAHFFDTVVVNTGQHKEMTDSLLDFFEIVPEVNLSIMRPDQSLISITAHLMLELEKTIIFHQPDIIFIQGDTTSVLAGALSAFFQKIPIAHLEAGLRTHNKHSPFPEELNRYFASYMAKWHFAPTEKAKQNLIKENIKENVFVVGNTAIDSLMIGLDKIKSDLSKDMDAKYSFIDFTKKIILVTGHRRENHGEPFINICKALKKLLDRNEFIEVVYPVHLNPNVQKVVYSELLGLSRMHLLNPLDYPDFIWLMNKSYLILTDSGGIQEEAPSLKKPVLIMRENTERQESVKAGLSKLVGSKIEDIIRETELLLTEKTAYSKMVMSENPYGDGQSSKRIVKILKKILTS